MPDKFSSLPRNKKRVVLSLKVPTELKPRLAAMAARTKMKKSDLVLTAIEAVLAAIERDDGLVVPVGFTLTLDVQRRPSLVYQETPDSKLHAADPAPGFNPAEAGRQALLHMAAQADSSPAGKASPAPRK